MSQKTWGGRFEAGTDQRVEEFTESISFDRRLYPYDIKASQAHAAMLAEIGLLTAEEAHQLHQALDAIGDEIRNGQFAFSTAQEDIHTHIEQALIQRLGDLGRKLHTGRSRNDQVVTDLKLWLRDAAAEIDRRLRDVQRAFLSAARRYHDLILPGYTHLQRAQPVLASHYFLAYIEKFQRDRERIQTARRRADALPLGTAALAGTSIPVNRDRVRVLLGFESLARNSLDASSDRDFVLDYVYALTVIAIHLSGWAEEWVIWSTTEFGFLDLPDAFCTGSSIMPQKKNPDVPELVRGKTGRVFGHLMGLLTLMKGQPLAYNKDNQEDKEPIFDTVDTLTDTLKIYADMLKGVRVKPEAMRQAATEGFSTATDLADYLVKKGLPFRDAHEVVARAVRVAEAKKCDLAALGLVELQAFSPLISEDVYQVLTLEGSLAARSHVGGTAPDRVKAAIDRAREKLAAVIR